MGKSDTDKVPLVFGDIDCIEYVQWKRKFIAEKRKRRPYQRKDIIEICGKQLEFYRRRIIEKYPQNNL